MWTAGLLYFHVSTLPAADHDWYRWRGPALNGISQESGWTTTWPQEGPKQLWKTSVGIGFSSVSVSQGRVYTLGNEKETDTVFCLEAETGAVVWKHSYACPLDATHYEGGPGSTPTVDGPAVYTLSKRGHLFCFAAVTGKVIWRKNLTNELGAAKPRWGFAGSPLVQENLLILNVGSAGTALDKTSGDVVWTSGKEPAGYATPVPFLAGQQKAVLIFAAKALVAVAVKTGQELWRHPWVTRWDSNIADPTVAGDKVFLSSFDRGGTLLQFDAGRPALLWANKEMGNHFASCVLFKGCLYGIDGNTDRPGVALRCLDFQTGQTKWSHAGLGLGGLLVADGKLMVLSDKGELVVADASPSAFKPAARAQVLGGKCWITPVLSNGRIYCRNAQGTLVCLDVKSPAKATSTKGE